MDGWNFLGKLLNNCIFGWFDAELMERATVPAGGDFG